MERRVYITVGEDEYTIKQGNCILDHLPGKPEFEKNAVMTFNQTSGIMHVESLAQSRKRSQKLEGKSYQLAIAHSDTCWSRQYALKDKQIYNKGTMKLAVCLVVCDSQGSIFLTLRSKNMRVFPNSWVLPGGHIDPGESLEEGVIRELVEETGIEIR